MPLEYGKFQQKEKAASEEKKQGENLYRAKSSQTKGIAKVKFEVPGEKDHRQENQQPFR